MATDMKPRVSRKGKQLQLCYDLPHRVNAAKIYPKTAPNGSTVVVYGHSNGLRVIWRGGRSLKPKAASSGDGQPKVNGTSNDAVMIDLTDDEPSQAPPTVVDDDVEFESEEEEEDEAEPYPPVVQQLDLPLGTEVLYMSFPQVPTISPYRPADLIPPIFNERIVLSVVCADSSVRVVTLPLTPPSHARKAADRSKSKAPYGEQVLRIEGQHGHQSIPRGITMTWSSRTSDTFPDGMEMDADASDDDDTDSFRSRKLIQSDEPLEWDLIVASHSVEVTGLLHIFRIPLVLKDNQFSFTAEPVFPYQTQYLSSPATRVYFSSSQFPSPRHLQLLVADSKGSVKVYDPLAPPRARPRSAGRDVVIEPKPGAWIASFSTSFEIPKHIKASNPYLARRKGILDAKWASDGKSIVALLSDGEWGVWAMDGASTARNASTKPVSTFALRGYVSGAEHKASTSTGPAQVKPSSKSLTLAPMTPNTRRTREETLFHGPVATPTTDSSHGGVSISSSFTAVGGGQVEDSIVIFYGDDLYRIPNLQQFWSRSTHSTSSGSLYGPGLTRVDGASLYGEPVTDVEQFGKPKGAAARMGVPRDLLVVGERRIVVLATVSPEAKAGGNLFARELEATDRTDRVDQDLLRRGELDIGGMDRMLDTLASGGAGTLGAGGPQGALRLGNGPAAQNVRRVGFAGLSSLGSSR
ncbi:hypothetical protein SLS58_005230 [Diplodia intermedia]|uniref:Nucleoporin NUP37 n=1 Tax=Diplodia intermedia TaxID=856260 RepID=A0ABR3TR88_9PEZI